MPSGTAARRYAQAVFEMADQGGTLDTWERDLGRLTEGLNDPGVAGFFENPQVPAAQKRAAVESILGAEGQPLTRNLAGLLIERGRFGLTPQIYASFIAQAREVAREEADKQLQQSLAQLRAEEQRVRNDLRQEFADMVILAASRVVRQELDQRKHLQLINETLREADSQTAADK